MNYTLPTTLTVGEREYAIRTDFRVILDLIEIFNDPDFTDADKAEAILEMFYIDTPEDMQEAIHQCYVFIDMGDDTSLRRSPARLVDWEKDFRYIIAPVNRVLGYDARSVRYNGEENTGGLHWWTFLSAYMEIGECLFAQIVTMRDKARRGSRLEKHEREWLRRNRELVDLPRKYSEADAEMERKWAGG